MDIVLLPGRKLNPLNTGRKLNPYTSYVRSIHELCPGGSVLIVDFAHWVDLTAGFMWIVLKLKIMQFTYNKEL